MVVEQLPVGVTTVLAAPVGVHEQLGRGWLGQKVPLQGRCDQPLGHGGHNVPPHDVLAGQVLKGVQSGSGTMSERQTGAARRPDPVGLGRFGLVQQPVGGAAQAMRRVGRARGVGLGLQGVQAPAAHGRAQALAAHPVAFFTQGHLQPARAVAAFVVAKDLDQRFFPGR